METTDIPAQPARRTFFKQAGAFLLGAAALLAPVAAGLTAFLAPLRRNGQARGFIHLTSLNALPADGRPIRLTVLASRTDAWTRTPEAPIGAVFLRRTGENSVTAFNVVCPHAGCFVEYRSETQNYLCPCHDSRFALDGKISSPRSPSPRGLDELETEVRADGQVWVKFQNFRTGVAQKVPV